MKNVVSVRDLEQVKLLVFQLNRAVDMTRDGHFKGPSEIADHLERIIHRFMETKLEDDRA